MKSLELLAQKAVGPRGSLSAMMMRKILLLLGIEPRFPSFQPPGYTELFRLVFNKP
jgi:hypothetical protein